MTSRTTEQGSRTEIDSRLTPVGPILQTTPAPPNVSLREGMRRCADMPGINARSVVTEVRRMRKHPGRVSANDFFYYHLFSPDYDDRSRTEFVGHKLEQPLHRLIFDRSAASLANDKCQFETTLRAAGFPTPKTRCVFGHKNNEAGKDWASLTKRDELISWIQTEAKFPMFGKPRFGIRSTGVLSIESANQARTELTLVGGRCVRPDELADALKRYRRKGYVFQDLIEQHPNVVALVGKSLATVRIIVLSEPHCSSVLRALWKIPVGNSVADNYWRGNILAALDHTTGTVRRAVAGLGLDRCSIGHHPDTGAPLINAVVPHWNDLVDMVLDASKVIEGIDMQAWDVAISNDGPVLMEVNIGGDYNLPQLAHGEGMLTQDFINFLSRAAKRRGKERQFNRMRLDEIHRSR